MPFRWSTPHLRPLDTVSLHSAETVAFSWACREPTCCFCCCHRSTFDPVSPSPWQTRGGGSDRTSLACVAAETAAGDFRGTFSPAEGPGRTGICPLSESEEEEEEEEERRRRKSVLQGPPLCLFERDCTELDLTLIEEN